MTDGLTPDEEQELHELEIHFARSGGRSVEVADRIDYLRAKRDDDEVEHESDDDPTFFIRAATDRYPDVDFGPSDMEMH